MWNEGNVGQNYIYFKTIYIKFWISQKTVTFYRNALQFFKMSTFGNRG